MAEKNEILEKTLYKKYGAVQIKEAKVAEDNTKLAKEFSSNTSGLIKTLNKEMKVHSVLDIEIKGKYNINLKDLKAAYSAHNSDIKSRVQTFNAEHKKELKSSIEKHEFANDLSSKLVVQINKDYDILVKEVKAQYNLDINTSEKEKERLIAQSEKDIEGLLASLKDIQDKYETLVANLNEKSDVKAKKLNEATTKKARKHNIDIEEEQLKTDKSIADLKSELDEILGGTEEIIENTKHKFQNKESAIKSTLESRVARHKKFLKKAIAQEDNRSIKEHRRNIARLEKETDKELRLLQKDYENESGVLNKKKIELKTANINKIAAFESDFIKFKEEEIYQIDLLKIGLVSDLEENKLHTKQYLADELNKYNEYFTDNDREQAENINQNDIDLEKQNHLQANLIITFNKTNNTNEINHQEALAVKESEVKVTKLLQAAEEVLAKLALEVELEKLNSEKLVAEKELVQDIKINEEKELIEYYSNDFNKQTSINTENLNHHSEIAKLFNKRAKGISEYEELELNNRLDLKLTFLQEYKVLVEKDNEKIMEKVEQVFESEKEMFDLEIDKLAKSGLDELAELENVANEEINIITEKRDALNPREYKKEIRVLNLEILDKKEDLEEELEKHKAIIDSKVLLYKNALEQAEVRRFSGLNDATSLYNDEQIRLDNVIELVRNEKNEESLNIKERFSSTTNDANDFYSKAEERYNSVTKENTNYKNSRIEKGENTINDTKSLFEEEKHELAKRLEQLLSGFETQKNSENQEVNDEKHKEEKLLEAKVNDYNNQVNREVQVAEGLNNDQGNANRTNVNRIEQKYRNHLSRVANELRVKIENYRVKTIEVEKETNEKIKNFDSSKKVSKKNYDTILAKGLANINQKLQQDIKKIL